MTVSELIERLRSLPPDARVVLPVESDFEVCKHVGLHRAYTQTRTVNQYCGSVRLRWSWETEEDLADEGVALVGEVVMLGPDEETDAA